MDVKHAPSVPLYEWTGQHPHEASEDHQVRVVSVKALTQRQLERRPVRVTPRGYNVSLDSQILRRGDSGNVGPVGNHNGYRRGNPALQAGAGDRGHVGATARDQDRKT